MLNMLMIIAGELTEANQATETGRTGISAVLDNFNTIIETIQNLCLVIGIVIVILLVFASFFSVRKRSTKYTKAQITELKKSGKYIPGVFVELNESKEVLRYFLNGEKWKGRVIRKYNFIYKNFYGDILRQANNDENIRLNLSRRETLGEIENAVGSALDYHERFSKGQVKLKESYKESEHLFRIVYHPYLDALQELQSFVQASNRNYIVLTGSAGNGKTNLLCSIAELAINLKQPVLFLNSRDIDGTVIEYIQDSLRVQEQLKKHPKVYFRTLNTLLAIRGKHFFIIIDAINENDHEDFGAAINKFVNAMAEYPRIKILVSCRSEYYTERFSEPLSKTITQNHLVYDLKSSAYPETAIMLNTIILAVIFQKLLNMYSLSISFCCVFSLKLIRIVQKTLCQFANMRFSLRISNTFEIVYHLKSKRYLIVLPTRCWQIWPSIILILDACLPFLKMNC